MTGVVLALALAVAPQALGASTAVVVEVDGGEVPVGAVRSAVWHALYDRHGHDALVLPDLESAPGALLAHHLTEVVLLQISWEPLIIDVPGVGKVGSMAPTVTATEYALQGEDLEPATSWTTYGALALYQVRRQGSEGVVALPQVSLQETLGLAVDPVRPPVWEDAPPDLVAIPVVVAADTTYREWYGADWKLVADLRVERASALLSQAGLRLEIVDHQAWSPDPDQGDLSVLLDDLASLELAPGALRVGFTQQTGLDATWEEAVEDVGRAYRPGQDVVVADQAMAPGHASAWDEAEEGAAIAHEILHALGLPHLEAPGHLMAATKSGTVHDVSPAARELGRTAAVARYAHWDAITAMNSLAAVAREHLDSRGHQLDFITGNLHTGLGVPAPGKAAPGELSALSNAAMARYYLDLAEVEPTNADALRQTALAHSVAALEAEPDLEAAAEVLARIEALQAAEIACTPCAVRPTAAASPPPSPTLGRRVPWFGPGTAEATE